MKTYYALIARVVSHTHEHGRGHAGQLDFIDTEAESRVEAILKFYQRLSEDNSEITALKTDSQAFMLGLTAEEWDELSRQPIRIKEGYPEKSGVQIQAISETPFI